MVKTPKYKFEWNDLRCLITVINVILIMKFGLSIAWFGLATAFIGLIKDYTDAHKKQRYSGKIMHLATMVLNCFFIYNYLETAMLTM